MKILYFLPGTGVGGIGKFVIDIVERMSSTDTFTFIALGNPNTHLAKYLQKKGKFLNYPGWNIEVLKGVYNELRCDNYDIVHAHLGCWSFIILSIAKICDVKKRIAHTHSADSFSTMNIMGKLIWMLSRIINPFVVTRYLACSDHAGKATFGYNIINSRRYSKVLNPVDDTYFSKIQENNIRKENHIPANAIVICHIGYMGYHKNHPFILSLANTLKTDEIYWILVGDGKNRKKFEQECYNKKLDKVIFLGIRNDIPQILDASDMFILPSLLEGLGTVVLEAQARGKKCIISEHVTLEVDMGLGLIHQVPLIDINKWIEEIRKKDSPKIGSRLILERFKKRNVEINSCITYMKKIYTEDVY